MKATAGVTFLQALVEYFPAYSSMISGLVKDLTKNRNPWGDIESNEIEVLRVNLIFLLKKVPENATPAREIYKYLCELAQEFPENDKDPLTGELVSSSESIALSSGYRFNLSSLTAFYGFCKAKELQTVFDPANPDKNLHLFDFKRIQESCEPKLQNFQTDIEGLYQFGKTLLANEENHSTQIEALAVHYLIMAAAQKHVKANYELSRWYLGMRKKACHNWGSQYLGGITDEGIKNCLPYLTFAVSQGLPAAMILYANLLWYVQSVFSENNREKASSLIDPLVKQGNLEAILAKITMLCEQVSAIPTSTDIKLREILIQRPNEIKLKQELQPLIARGHQLSKDIYHLFRDNFPASYAVLYQTQLEEFVKQDKFDSELERTILDLLEQASRLGHIESSYILAKIYTFGRLDPYIRRFPIAPDPERATFYLKKAASAWHPDAVLGLIEILTRQKLLDDGFYSDQTSHLFKDYYNPQLAEAVLDEDILKNPSANSRAKSAFRKAEFYRMGIFQQHTLAMRKLIVTTCYAQCVKEYGDDIVEDKILQQIAVFYLTGDAALGLPINAVLADEILSHPAAVREPALIHCYLRFVALENDSSNAMLRARCVFWLEKDKNLRVIADYTHGEVAQRWENLTDEERQNQEYLKALLKDTYAQIGVAEPRLHKKDEIDEISMQLDSTRVTKRKLPDDNDLRRRTFFIPANRQPVAPQDEEDGLEKTYGSNNPY